MSPTGSTTLYPSERPFAYPGGAQAGEQKYQTPAFYWRFGYNHHRNGSPFTARCTTFARGSYR